MLFGIIVGVAVFAVLLWAYHENTLPETILTLVLLAGVVSCHQSDYWQQHIRETDAQEAAEARADATPRVIREVDGCKVYKFKESSKWHYITRCPASTTTEAHHDEEQGTGKQRKTVDVAETITTVNAK